jgi:ATP-dependent DNA helicase RecG
MTVAARSHPITLPLARPVSTLWGVGPERATLLARLEIHTVEDLLLHRPRRYEDRRNLRTIAELQQDQPGIVRGTVVALGVKWFGRHTKSIFELILDDGTARLHCRWWNLPSMEKHFAVGEEVVVFGKLDSVKPRTIDHPETEVVGTGEESSVHFNRITPIYPLTEGLSQRWLRALIWRTLEQVEGLVTDPWPQVARSGSKAELGASKVERPLPSRAQAIRQLHFPDALDSIEPARQRLALDEFVQLQTQMLVRRRNLETKAQPIPCAGNNRLIKPFLGRLGFKLTQSQTRVLREIRKDLSGKYPMRRLLQGDVGSGKTVVAACSALMALESNLCVALMAPTEILAEQHFLNFSRWFEPLGTTVELRTGSRKTGIGHGELTVDGQLGGGRSATPTLSIGTHALIESGFSPENLGLVIIDEQHRFGVSQRERLVRKGRYPHLLVMTATPIPRTLGLTLYGDLDLSTIDDIPPGRGRIQTFVRTVDALPKVRDFVRSQLKDGRQAYVVYPRIEQGNESDDGIKAVTQEFEALRQTLAPFKVALVHGRLRSREKEAVMAEFRANKAQVLLATSLIEVGIDIPNATVMLIENAEQFGLAQLHQLRGRIGRGAHTSYFILVAAARSPEARQRLRVLEETTDGFRIAEADLKLRGPGELLGQEQSGIPRFRFGDFAEDLALVEQARQIAMHLVRR